MEARNSCYCDGVTEKAKAAAAVPSKLVGGSSRQIRKVIQRREVSASRPAMEDEVFDFISKEYFEYKGANMGGPG
jgi:hypothetical protein